jgi:hypothetical protein
MRVPVLSTVSVESSGSARRSELGGDRRGLRFLSGKLGMRGDLHFEVGGRDVESAVAVLEQHIRENWQRVPSFDDTRHGLQGFQQRIAGYLI